MAEEKKTCETCWHSYLGPGYEPCASCDDDCSNWETANTKKAIEEMSGIGKEPEKYTYYVVYAFITKDCTDGINGSIFDLDHKLDAVNIILLQDSILKNEDLANVCILNWKELEG